MTYHQCSMDKAKAMKQFPVSLVKDTSDSAEHALVSAQVLPALSPRYCKADPVCFGREPSYCSEEVRIIDWDLYLDYDWDLCLDYQRYYGRLNCTMMKGTEVLQGESQREPQVSPGDVDKAKIQRSQINTHLTCSGRKGWNLRPVML